MKFQKLKSSLGSGFTPQAFVKKAQEESDPNLHLQGNAFKQQEVQTSMKRFPLIFKPKKAKVIKY